MIVQCKVSSFRSELPKDKMSVLPFFFFFFLSLQTALAESSLSPPWLLTQSCKTAAQSFPAVTQMPGTLVRVTCILVLGKVFNGCSSAQVYMYPATIENGQMLWHSVFNWGCNVILVFLSVMWKYVPQRGRTGGPGEKLSWKRACLAAPKPWCDPHHYINQAPWCTLVLPALRRWRQETRTFKVSFGYSSRVEGQPGYTRCC